MTSFPFTPIDLTHTLDDHTPSWSGACGYIQETKLDYDDSPTEVKFKVQKLSLHAGIGTHMDAPAHCYRGAPTIDHLPLATLILPCVVIDVSAKADPRYRVSEEDIIIFENTHGQIPPGSLVFIHTGWDRYWHTPDAYRNNHVFPSVSELAAKLLLERSVEGLGIDTLSPDRPENGFPVHGLFLGNHKYLIENATRLSTLPPVGSFVGAFPLKIKEGTEAPLRLVGFVPQ